MSVSVCHIPEIIVSSFHIRYVMKICMLCQNMHIHKMDFSLNVKFQSLENPENNTMTGYNNIENVNILVTCV